MQFMYVNISVRIGVNDLRMLAACDAMRQVTP